MRLGGLGLCALILLTAACTGQIQGPTTPAAALATVDCTLPVPALGAQFHGTWSDRDDAERARELDALASSGAKWVRIDVGWPNLQPKGPDAYDLAWGVKVVDRAVEMAADRDLSVLMTFWLTPDWANGGAGRRVLPTDVGSYARALAWAADRYHGKVQAWEIWNEPNSASFLDPPDPVAYARLLSAGYAAVKGVDPSADVVFGGTMYVDVPWISKVLDAGAAHSFDVMAVHPYPVPADLPPETPDNGSIKRFRHLAALDKELEARGLDTPVWLTEFGWSAHQNSPSTKDWATGVTENLQAAYLARSIALLQKDFPRVKAVFWYPLRDTDSGRLHSDNRGLLRRDFSPRPVFDEFASIASKCTTQDKGGESS